MKLATDSMEHRINIINHYAGLITSFHMLVIIVHCMGLRSVESRSHTLVGT